MTPHLPIIGKIFNTYKHLIYKSPSLSKIFSKGSIIPSYWRTKNIKEFLACPRKTIYHTGDQSQCGCFKCNVKCNLCQNFLLESNCFTSTSTNRTYPIRQFLHCKLKNVIYLVTCRKCSIQYINDIKVRFRKHKSSMTTKKNTCEIAIHFNRYDHVLSGFEFVIIEQICNSGTNNNGLDEHLLGREAFCECATLHPSTTWFKQEVRVLF